MAEFLEQLLKAGSTVSFVICNGEVGVRSYEAGKAEMTFLMMAFFLKGRFPSQQFGRGRFHASKLDLDVSTLDQDSGATPSNFAKNRDLLAYAAR